MSSSQEAKWHPSHGPKVVSTVSLETDISVFRHHVRLTWECVLTMTRRPLSSWKILLDTPLHLHRTFKMDITAISSIYPLLRSHFFFWESFCFVERLEMKISLFSSPENLASLCIAKFCLPNHSFFSSSFSCNIIAGKANGCLKHWP